VSSIALGLDDEGREVAVRVGRYGPYVQAGNSDLRASIPEDFDPDDISLERAL
jgi:DNA topoisomerase-1